MREKYLAGKQMQQQQQEQGHSSSYPVATDLGAHGVAVLARRQLALGGSWISCGTMGSFGTTVSCLGAKIESGPTMHWIGWHRQWVE